MSRFCGLFAHILHVTAPIYRDLQGCLPGCTFECTPSLRPETVRSSQALAAPLMPPLESEERFPPCARGNSRLMRNCPAEELGMAMATAGLLERTGSRMPTLASRLPC